MTRDRTRLARRALVALLVVVSGAVVWNLRRPSARPTPVPTRPSPSAGQGTTAGILQLLRFREGSRKIAVKAKAMAGREGDAMRLQGVELVFPFVQEGQPANATVTADECLYQPGAQRASFKGNVHVRTDDGFELDSDSLKYWGQDGRMFTRDPVRFRRGAASGTAAGLEYKPETGLSLAGKVSLRIENAGQVPTDVEAGGATASRSDKVVEFEQGVVVREGERELRSRRLQLNLSADMRSIERAAAIDDVDLKSGAGGGLPGTGTGAVEGGAKRLRCRRLNLVWREKGILQEAIAVNAASLEIEPGAHGVRERRRIAAPQLRFDFDAQGRLVSLQGLPARQPDERVSRAAVLTTEPLPPASGGARRIESASFLARLDPLTGDLQGADFAGAVAFSEPGRRAWAEKAVYDEAAGLVTLQGGEPRIVDEEQGSELRARQILLGTRTKSVSATDNVRHTVQRRGRSALVGPLGSGDEPTVLLCRQLDYDAARHTARYRDNALMRSGQDEVRAPLIVLEDPGEGQRRMSASGGVTSTLHPRRRAEKGATRTPARGGEAGAKASGPPAPVESRSKEMVYDEKAQRVVYSGDVELRQGDILTRSPEAIVVLTADGQEMEKLLAGAPVEVRQGARVATGDHGTYTPSDEMLVLVGEKVVLNDGERRMEGRILTFQVGGDRIRMDGREEVRTEALFKRKELAKP